MPEIDNTTIAQTIGGIFVALVGVSVGLQRIVKSWKSTDAETSVIELLHTELDRLSKQNNILAVELNKLQTEIISLNRELRSLTYENQRLHTEVGALTAEVMVLKSMLQIGDTTNVITDKS